MQAFLIGIGAAIMVAALFFLAALAYTFVGAFAGWVVAWAFDETTVKALEFFSLTNYELWEIGAVLGFLSSFIRSSTTVNKD
jgi:hypothetical protein